MRFWLVASTKRKGLGKGLGALIGSSKPLAAAAPTVEEAAASLELELQQPDGICRAAAVYGLGRAGQIERLENLAERETDPIVRTAIDDARSGNTPQQIFAKLAPQGMS